MDFRFEESYILENRRVFLRPLHLSDLDYLIEFGRNEPEIWKFNFPGAGGREKFQLYFETAIKLINEKSHYAFIVFDKKYNKYARMTRFYDISNEFKRLDIGFTWYGERFQGTGLNKNCKYLLLQLAFDKLNMQRVGFSANSQNHKSINAMKGIGCKVEGVLRRYSKDAEGNITDIVKLSITKCDWESYVKEQLLKNIEAN